MSARKKWKLLKVLKHHSALLDADGPPPGQLPVSPPAMGDIHRWRSNPALAKAAVQADLAWLQQPGRQVLFPGDADWPESLMRLVDPPLPLYFQGTGEALDRPLLAIVGSRKPTPAGRETAYRLAAELSRLGFGIISGLAFGIDTAAHKGTLDNGGITVAVTATGPDLVYPPQNAELAANILASGGAVLTEQPVGQPPKPYQFPMRNRILAALARGVLVVEAAERSGALITAHIACELGIEVMAIPGAVQGGASAGCHKLIRDGAALVENTLQILECLSCLPPADTDLQRLATAAGDACPPGLDEDEHKLWSALSLTPTPADLLAEQLGWSIVQVGTVVSRLEIAGVAHREAGGYIRAS